MKEHIFKDEETPLKFQQKTHLNLLSKDQKNSENIFTDQNLLGLSKTKVLNIDENINTKITQVSLKEMQNNQNFQNLKKNPFVNNSSPKLKNSKDLFSRIDNSPIKNMDLSPFKNLNYIKNSENSNQISCINTNVKINLNSKLENISKGLNLIENKNIINQQNSYIKKNECLHESPKFFDVKNENKTINIINPNYEKKITNDNKNLIDTKITKYYNFPDTNHENFHNLLLKTNTECDSSNNYLNTLSINNVSIINCNMNLDQNNMIPSNSNVSFAQSNIFNIKNSANDNFNNFTSKQYNYYQKNTNQQQSFSNIANSLNIKPFEINSNSELINNNKNLIGFNSNLGFNAMQNQHYHHYYKGNISIYSRESEIDITKNPFENKINKQESINPFKRSIAREHLDKFEKDNELFVNNQLNYRGQHVHLNASAKPSLSLIESRNRLGIFSKVFQEDKFNYENVYDDNYNTQKIEKSSLLNNNIENTTKNPFNNKYNFDKSAFSNLKSKNKKSDLVENNIEIINEKSENITPNEKFENYKSHEGKNNSINLINTKDNSMDEESEYLKKLKKLEDTEKFYEMIEEFEDESKIEDENSFCLSIKKEYLSSSINRIQNKTEKARFEDSKENFNKIDNSAPKILKKKDSEDESDKRKKLPENVNIFQLIQQYPELYILCRKINSVDIDEKVEFDVEKFKRLVEEEMNLLIPLNRKNDEVFKRKIIAKKMLNEKLSENQSAKRSDTYYSKPPQEILDNGIIKLSFLRIQF